MKQFVCVLIWSFLLLNIGIGYAQLSPNAVGFQVTYDPATTRYTAWVVPQYNLPNANNPDTLEKGGTAQFTLKVPTAFVISDIVSIRGSWTTDFLKLGPGNPGQNWDGFGLDPTVNYYVIGKAPVETNYGRFVSGTPVALFTFKGNGCFGPISPLEPGSPFIAAAYQRYSLNVGNSFYSNSGQPTSGNQNPLEQFQTLVGPPAQCSALLANPDSQTLTAGTSITIPILANDTRNGQPLSATSVTVTIGPPSSGTATVNADGTVNYVAAAGFSGPASFTYTICDGAQPTLCSSALVSLTVISATPPSADLLITKQASQSVTTLNGTVSFTVTVQNLGPGNALGVVVTDSLTRNNSVVLLTTPTASQGSFDATTGLWTVGNLASGGVATLVLTVRVQSEGVLVNVANVSATGSQEVNLSNNTASACTSVPIRLCADNIVVANVPSGYQDVRWFLNGNLVATGNSLSLTQAGVYTITSASGACPIGGCCPIIVENGDCCPPPKCVPFLVTRSR
ncbi:Ig-like domain-containing protein [Spirosoma flavus]